MTVVRRSHWSRARPYGRFNRRNERSSEHSSDMISSSREMLASSIADDWIIFNLILQQIITRPIRLWSMDVCLRANYRCDCIQTDWRTCQMLSCRLSVFTDIAPLIYRRPKTVPFTEHAGHLELKRSAITSIWHFYAQFISRQLVSSTLVFRYRLNSQDIITRSSFRPHCTSCASVRSSVCLFVCLSALYGFPSPTTKKYKKLNVYLGWSAVLRQTQLIFCDIY